MTVHMHGVAAKSKVVVYNQPHSLVRSEIHHIVFFREIKVAELSFKQHWIIVIASETDVIHKPEVEICLVGAVFDDQIFSR